jgi:hypothetical protein
MFRRLTLSATLGALLFSASCAEAPKKRNLQQRRPRLRLWRKVPFMN